MRAALLPTPGDPATIRYWLRNYATWRREVDELLVLVNGSDPIAGAEVVEMVRAAGGKCLWVPDRIGHEGAILALLRGTTAERVVLCEDDAYVRHPGAVRAAFDRLGTVDIVGSPRHEDYFTSPLQEWGPYVAGDLRELRHGLWPTFLFIRRADLLETDCQFGAQAWPLRTTITGWGEVTEAACAFVGTAPTFMHLDTFFGTTFQLRAAGKTVELVHHVRVYDPTATEGWLGEDPPWFHVTGLSTLDWTTEPDLSVIPDYGAGGGLWPRRLAWWRRMGVDVEMFIRRAEIDPEELDRWDRRFAPWVTW